MDKINQDWFIVYAFNELGQPGFTVHNYVYHGFNIADEILRLQTAYKDGTYTVMNVQPISSPIYSALEGEIG